MRFVPRLSLVTAPATEPVALDEAKTHLRVTSSDEDALIAGLIQAAREWCEGFTERAFITQSWRADYRYWNDPIRIPRPPLISLTSVEYYDLSNTLQTLSSSEYTVTGISSIGWGNIRPTISAVWPPVYPRDDAVQVSFQAGYGSASAVPSSLKSAMLLVIGHLYENRETTTPLQIHKLPMGVEALLTPYCMATL